jgi:competence protein ComEC
MSSQQGTGIGAWWLAGGVFLGILSGHLVVDATPAAPVAIGWFFLVVAVVLMVALRHRPRWGVVIGLAAAASGFGLGASERRDEARIEAELERSGQTAVRLSAAAIEGWTADRWGHRTRVRIETAVRRDEAMPLPSRARMEVRGVLDPSTLPRPGTPFQVLAEVKGPAAAPLLVVAAPRLIRVTGAPRGPAALRQRLVDGLRVAAGTDVRRHRAAGTAAALALGRRDEIPRHRQDGWRRSGLAHAFAVSGLHVGVIAGVLWLGAVAAGQTPNRARVLLLVFVPSYAVLAGAAPSAVRAAAMVALYLFSRLLGRAVDPLAALCLAASLLMVLDPGLASGPGFQLTVVVTAALIRWAIPLAERLRGPTWFRAAVAVPAVAALASSPIIAIHFGQVVPLAFVANLAAPVLLSVLIPMAVVTTALASTAPPLAAALLGLIGHLDHLLWWLGGAGRAWNPAVAPVPVVAIGALVFAGWVAMLRWRGARWAVLAWAAVWLAVPTAQIVGSGPGPERVEVLPVGDGTAILASSGAEAFLLDGGRSEHQAHSLLLAQGVRTLEAVVVSHGDADHLGGVPSVLARHRVRRLVIPQWMASEPAAVPMLRVARARGVTVHHMARGAHMDMGAISMSCYWPPATAPPEAENDRSLVARVDLPSGSLLVTGDISVAAERRICRTAHLATTVLIAPHHGSKTSSSAAFLDATDPEVVLIPAGPWNRYGHPDEVVLDRLSRRGLPFCAPVRHPLCRAVPRNGTWHLETGADS